MRKNNQTSSSKITAQDVFGCIKFTKEFLENNPGVINATNHVVKNGIKQGSYDVVKAAIDNVINNCGEEGIMSASLNGLNNTFQGSGNLGEDVKQLGTSSVRRYKYGAGSDKQQQKIIDAEANEIGYEERYDDIEEQQEYPVEQSQQLPADQQNTPGGLALRLAGGVLDIAGKLKKVQNIPNVLDKVNSTMESTIQQVDRLGGNITTAKNSGSRLLASMRGQVPATPLENVAEGAAQYVDDAAELANTGFTETAVQGVTSTLQKGLSSAAKGGVVGAAIGVTMEAVMSYKKYKSGELTKQEYAKEIMKSGGQFGISGAATAGITTAIAPALTAVATTLGAACPVVTIPVSIAFGVGIDKIVGPAFGRGEYKKILDDAKYYQNLMHAHDDLVQAIADSEQQFGMFIEEYSQQMQVHVQLTDTNQQINQLHKVANAKIQQQINDNKAALDNLSDLFNKI